MAETNMINLAGNQLPPEILNQQAEATRQQQLANLLTQQGTQQMPSGSMVSGHFVPASPFQYLAQYGNIAAGNYLANKATETNTKLAEMVRKGQETEKQAAIPLLKNAKYDELLALPNQYGGVTPFQKIATERMAPELPVSAQELEYAKTHPELLPFIMQKAQASSTKINLPPTENAYNQAFGKGVAEQDLALKNIAEGAKQTVGNIANQRRILDTGNYFSGKAGNIQNELANYGTALGVVGKSGQEKAANTQSLISGAAGITLDNIKGSGLGSGQGFTNKDLEFLNDAKSFKITWNKENIARVLDLQEKAAIEGAKRWNTRYGQIQKSATGPINVGSVEVPNPYGQVKLISIEPK